LNGDDDYVSINLSQLDLIALKNYLKIVHGFRTSDDPSGDTVAVDGIPSRFIAQASLLQDENGTRLVSDRSLVDLAQGLLCLDEEGKVQLDANGNPKTINANDLMTDLEGISFVQDASKAALNVAEDMRVLRNEMYHMKRDMMVTGNLDPASKVYNGLVDPFKMGLKKYINDTQLIDTITSDGIVQTLERGDYTAGQKLIIYGSNSDKQPVCREIIEVNNTELNVGEFFMDYTPDTVDKTYGVYRNGMFFFGKEDTVRDLDAGNSIHAIIKDGEQRVSVGELNLDKNVAGFATTFTVPASLNYTYLRQIDLILSVEGNPGNLHLEIYPYSETGIYDPNSEQCIMSNEMQSGKALSVFKTYSFTLAQDKRLETPGKYVVIVKAKGTSNGNIWKLGGFREPCIADFHQDTYWIGSDGALSPESADASGYLSDIYLGVGAVKTLEARYVPTRAGAYSGSFVLEQSEATRVRITFNPVSRDNKNDEFYSVIVKGRNQSANDDESFWVLAKGLEPSTISNRVWVNGLESGYQLVYDFEFDTPMTEIEFQITFNTPHDVSAEVYEGLMSLVVSTDNGIISNSLEDGDK
jgi:hypothetical protein